MAGAAVDVESGRARHLRERAKESCYCPCAANGQPNYRRRTNTHQRRLTAPPTHPPIHPLCVGYPSRLGLPFIDRPVNVETLATAAVEALFNASVRGVQDWRGMQKLASDYESNKPSRTAAAAAAESTTSTAENSGDGGVREDL